jgi:hypothetical protein
MAIRKGMPNSPEIAATIREARPSFNTQRLRLMKKS